MYTMASFGRALVRRRVENKDDIKSELPRVMGIIDLTALGVGATLGLGMYVLAGEVAGGVSGPAVCISFLIAAIASGLAGICYAEFASRVPKSGSAYAYSYATVGECVAFITGWNLIFEYVIGTACVARGFSQYAYEFFGHEMRDYMKNTFFRNLIGNNNWDFFACGVIIILTIILSTGTQGSSLVNRVIGVINVLTILTIIIAGSFKINSENWQIIPNSTILKNFTSLLTQNKSSNEPVEMGDGGFIPYGINGVIAGSALAFFGFVGFDSIASCGEEAKNPKRDIPISILIALIIVTIAYLGIAIVLTLVWPYYDLNDKTTFPQIFKKVDMPIIGHIVNIGGLCALSTSLIGAMFPLPRILYAMSNDGLLFKPLSWINNKTKTPLFSTIISGIVIGIMALKFDVKELSELASTATLLAYSIVTMSVLFLRYKKINENIEKKNETLTDQVCFSDYLGQIFNIKNIKSPSEISSQIASGGVLAFTGFSLIFVVIRKLMFSSDHTKDFLIIDNIVGYILLSIVGLLMIICIISMHRQPVAKVDINFRVPLAPLIPCISIFINLYLMTDFKPSTWMRFFIFLCIGMSIYFFYGIRNSLQGQKDQGTNSFKSKKVSYGLGLFFVILSILLIIYYCLVF